MNKREYTIEEIKRAFWSTFHESGEIWFSDEGGEESQESTEQSWYDFKENLEKERIDV